MGFTEYHRQYNQGPEQDGLDNLASSRLDVVTLRDSPSPPYIELLRYPPKSDGRPVPGKRDIAADRLIFRGKSGTPKLCHDPDGHAILWDASA
jgi:hypothetical protein